MGQRARQWSRRFRFAALLSVGIAMVWTIALILPFDPFSSLLQIMIGGEAGTWLLLSYVIYLAVGVGGFAGLSSILSSVEDDRVPNPVAMSISLVTLVLGVNASCILLAFAGASGGYAQTIQHISGTSLSDMLTPYVNVTRVAATTSVIGGVAMIVGIVMARGEKRSG